MAAFTMSTESGLRAVEATAFPLDEALVVVPEDSGDVCLLNGSARLLWERLRNRAPVGDIAGWFAHRFGLSPVQAAADVSHVLDTLAELGLLAGQETPKLPEDTDADPAGPLAGTFEPALDAVYRMGPAPVRIRCEDPELAVLIDAAAAPARAVTPAADTLDVRRTAGLLAILCGEDLLFVSENPAEVRSEVFRHAILRAHPGRCWLGMLHAAVVGAGGSCILMSGASGSGKSTLAATLIARGLDFVTDDYAPLEQGSRQIWPVPFGLSVKAGSWDLLGRQFAQFATSRTVANRGRPTRYIWPSEQPPVPPSAGLTPRMITFPKFVPGAGLEVERLSGAQALALFAHGGAWLNSEPACVAELVDFLGTMPAVALTYGDLDAATDWILGKMESCA
jgi:hypothetical protein